MRPTGVRTAALALTTAVLAATSGCSTDPCERPLALVSCVGPTIDDQPPGGSFGAPRPTVAPGSQVVLHGHFYTETCNDTGGCAPLVPMGPVRLVVTWPDGSRERLGPFQPGGSDVGFRVTLQVPADSPPGRVRVRDDRRLPARYAFRVGGA